MDVLLKTTTTTTTTTQKKRAPLADRFVGRSRRKTFDEREGIYRHGGGAVVVVVVDGGVDVVFCTTTTTTTTQCNEKGMEVDVEYRPQYGKED